MIPNNGKQYSSAVKSTKLSLKKEMTRCTKNPLKKH